MARPRKEATPAAKAKSAGTAEHARKATPAVLEQAEALSETWAVAVA